MNNVILMGNIGGDLELRHAGETPVVDFSLATSRMVKGEKVTDWHKIVLWGKAAETACKYVGKGSQIVVEGSIRNESYEKDGETKYITKIHCYKFHFAGGKSEPAQKQAEPAQKEEQVDDLPF